MKTSAAGACLVIAVLCGVAAQAAGLHQPRPLGDLLGRAADGNATTEAPDSSPDPTDSSPADPEEDVCFRYSLIKIYCKRQYHRCFFDSDCAPMICCPYGNCGNRCVPSGF